MAHCCSNVSSYKQDSVWSWFICLSTTTCMILTFGFSFALGVLLPVFMDSFEESREKAAWVSSITFGVATFLGPITGGVLNRFGLRITTILGCLFCSVGMAAGSFAPSIVILYIAFSLPFAVGVSLVYVTSTIIVTHYFTKRRSLALGLVTAGQGLGQMILGPTLQALVDVFDWRKTFRVFAGIVAVASLNGCLLRERTTSNERLNTPHKKFRLNLSLLKEPTIVILLSTIPFFTTSRIVPHVHLVVLVAPASQKVKPSEKVPHKIYQVPYKPDFLDDIIRLELEGNKVQMMLKTNEILPAMCEGLLNSTEVFKELQGFDLLVYDSSAFGAVLLGEHFGIPRVEIMPIPPNNPFASYFHAIPIPVSYVPELLTGFSDEMTFVERAINFGAYLAANVFMKFAFERPLNALKVKYNIKPERSIMQATSDAELVIMTADFALEYPQPLLPGSVMVGPLSARDGRPLPPDLEKFVINSGGHGFIIVSFGSNVASILSRKVVDMLAEAFGRLKQKVVWRLKGYIPSFLGANIKIVDWLPQNDLLAHKDIRAFVSHVGHNSLYESAYHGVPLVAFPLYGDQQGNAKKAEHFGLGLAVHHKTNNAQELFETIQRVISEPRFKSKAMHLSGLLKDRRRTPLQETCDWIEYVLRHGGARHLRAQVLDIPWYQYYLLDVIAFIVAIATMVVMVIRLACRCLCRVCCRKGDGKDKKD